uniref:non-specific serine/threonine protein kinase n=1 Tax=Rhizophora mucronata TaxID=61149 RepID=A0A2P2Q6J1_RHIMU
MEMYRKIAKADLKFPSWFGPDVRRLLSKILDPDPNTRISMAKIMENSWFRNGLEPKPLITETEVKEMAPLDCEAVFSVNENNCTVVESKQESTKPCNLNAFGIISYSAGFDLSGLFEDKGQKKEVQFTSDKPATTILAKIKNIAVHLKLKIKKRDAGLLKLEGSKEGRKGVLGVDVEIFEITPCFHLVEMKKSSGDTLEYQKVLMEEIRPALKDIVWTWQGQHLQQEEQQEHQ